jgi:NitT/TauT family transport system substrate-binding protein
MLLSSCAKQENKNTVRLAYMPNVTHAVPLIGLEKGFYQEELGSNIKLKPMHFVVGNNIIDAFITNQIDVAYVGPGPFINSIYRGVPLKLLANSCDGGTTIVGTETCRDIKTCQGKSPRISVPQYGNTQDLILRKFIENNNIKNAKVIAIPPQDTATAFFTMSIDAACLPEPWGTILIDKAKCKIIKDEKEVLNNGNYPVTILVTNKKFAEENPEVISKLLIANKKTIDFINSNKVESIEITRNAISKITKKDIKNEIILKSLSRCTFNNKFDFNILKEFAEIGIKAGYYRKVLLERLPQK